MNETTKAKVCRAMAHCTTTHDELRRDFQIGIARGMVAAGEAPNEVSAAMLVSEWTRARTPLEDLAHAMGAA